MKNTIKKLEYISSFVDTNKSSVNLKTENITISKTNSGLEYVATDGFMMSIVQDESTNDITNLFKEAFTINSKDCVYISADDLKFIKDNFKEQNTGSSVKDFILKSIKDKAIIKGLPYKTITPSNTSEAEFLNNSSNMRCRTSDLAKVFTQIKKLYGTKNSDISFEMQSYEGFKKPFVIRERKHKEVYILVMPISN